MPLHPEAGNIAQVENLVNIPRLISCYYSNKPDINTPAQRVTFGTSGHRGSAFNASFTDWHIAAICQALAEHRLQQGITGPVFVGMDTHALSEPAFITTIEVLTANGVELIVQQDRGYTPTPVISHAILNFNKHHNQQADGIVITPSHNPPQDGGFKYNPPHGGPADTQVTQQIQQRANELIQAELDGVKRQQFALAMSSDLVQERDLADLYISELEQVIDMQAIADAGLKLGTDPLGGAGLHYWHKIAEKYGLDIEVVNTRVDPTFAFMHLDKDGQIRMDCSSPYAMAGLLELKQNFDLAFGNDADFDRHGIVSPKGGLLNPNHFLAVAVDYLYRYRPQWPESLQIGKTLVSSSMVDRVAADLNRTVTEMPVGFKWFVQGLSGQQIGFAGEESAGGIFLKRDGQVWATDKDGFIMCLLAAEIMAKTGLDPADYYAKLTNKHAEPAYKRVDVAATTEQKALLSNMDKSAIGSEMLAGESIDKIETHASGNQAAIGGVKVSTKNGWFAARPSGTEDVYKIYAESFNGQQHLNSLLQEAEDLVNKVLN